MISRITGILLLFDGLLMFKHISPWIGVTNSATKWDDIFLVLITIAAGLSLILGKIWVAYIYIVFWLYLLISYSNELMNGRHLKAAQKLLFVILTVILFFIIRGIKKLTRRV